MLTASDRKLSPPPSVARIREMPNAERPRERLRAHGAHALSAAELLAVVVGSGTGGGSALQVAQHVLARYEGSLRRLAGQPVAALTAVRGVARLLGNDTTIFNSDLPFAFIGNSGITLAPGFVVPVLAIIAFVVILASWYVLRRTVLGVWIYAVGGNPAAARLSGIKVWVILLFVYSLSGLLAGLGGVMSAARLYAANGLQLGQSYELDAIAAVILGGTSFVGGIGSIWGTLIGALIIAVLTNGLVLLGVSDIWQFIIKGLVIIGAVALDRARLQGSART